ncbi:branched-chain amino acid ABC transporter permease [Desulfohalobium retbaense]|uniref:Inner-membrane translocator n=1 Tax=Desulfohalobium retbaense (strain ATCC 49708 / DSM 5692 / JCM 16813 / HR100) TaxID=485915 RepID=C8X2A1_DESRD|nr:branched-chain amino acid ABC transporter permease [Desulfohalobium retbaense]ACV68424.1 inner-membrane translocator [Desulfohalobium retbaense DSM 5692]
MIWQQIVNGIVAGSAYALVALGYSLIYGVLGLINLAQGEIYMAGAFGLWIAAAVLGLPLPLAVLFGLLFSAVVGLSMERVVFRPLTGRHPLIPLLAAIGLSIFLQSVALLAFGPETRPFPLEFEPQLWNLGPVTLSTLQLLLVTTALALMGGLFWYVHASRHGQALQAVAMDREAARLVGIKPHQCVAQAFGIGGMLSGAAGMMMAAYYNATYPYMGVLPGLKGFCAAVLGGAGSIPGAILGGLILGLSENLGAAYIHSGFKDGYAFAILIAILLLRPQGLLGKSK